jgi:hypothetical protein
MMVLATFTTICGAAVLFLLRFLFALESESRSARMRQSENVSAYRTHSGSQVSDSAPVLMLVHYKSPRQVAAVRPTFMGASVSRERNSQLKGA